MKVYFNLEEVAVLGNYDNKAITMAQAAEMPKEDVVLSVDDKVLLDSLRDSLDCDPERGRRFIKALVNMVDESDNDRLMGALFSQVLKKLPSHFDGSSRTVMTAAKQIMDESRWE